MSDLRVILNINTGPFVAAVKRAAASAHKMLVALHRSGVHITSRDPRIRRKHIKRCDRCNPAGFPKPLTIDGHEYARRRKGRSRR